MPWQRVATAAELELKERKIFESSQHEILLIYKNTRVFAVENKCPHDGFSLQNGEINDQCVLTCAWHGWEFNLETGKVAYGFKDAKTFPVKIENNEVFVDIPTVT